MPPPAPDVEGANNPLSGHPKYRLVRYLNRGSFGFVCEAVNLQTDEHVAIKFVEVNNEKDRVHSHREILNHQQLFHPHVVQLKEVLCVPPYLALVMELVPGGDLFQLVVDRRGLPEPEARWFFQQLVLGMDYCHRRGVANRDIKLENTLLLAQPRRRPLLKMCDFGYSKHDVLDSVATSKVGTPGYTAPEVITAVDRLPSGPEGLAGGPGGQPPARVGYDGKTADVWSAGVMLYTMLYARYPFERPEDKSLTPERRTQRTLQRILALDWSLPEAPAVSDGAKDLLRGLLVADPKARLTLAQVAAHPWFAEGLPAGSLEYNARALEAAQPPAQSPAEVDAVIEEAMAAMARARRAERAAHGSADDELLADVPGA